VGEVLWLLGIGFLAGVVTAISPCVLPVLPIVLAGGATGSERRPYAIVGGLVASFTVFTLFATWLLDRLGLPADFLRDAAIVLLFVVAATLLVPPFGQLLERPFAFLTRRPAGDLGGGFLLGASLGLVFVPCAGPVLAAVTVIAAHQDISLRAFALTLAYAMGAALPMLAVAAGGRRVAAPLRAHAQTFRAAAGVVIAGTALALTFHVDDHLRAVPGYTDFLQSKIEKTDRAQRELAKLTSGGEALAATSPSSKYLPASEFAGVSHWFNTPGGKPLTMRELRGKVVLIDFWTYTCINCLRTLPHLEAWDAAYRSQGLVIVGVHTPEFAFEHSRSNVAAAIERLGVRYPVPQDNDYATWDAYHNQYWPAEYLVDKQGRVVHVHFGEGEYEKTEALIRKLLAAEGPEARAVEDATPRELTTPESYLGWQRLARYAGSPVSPGTFADYRFPSSLDQNEIAYAGRWRVDGERIVAGPNARLRIRFRAQHVYLVLAGRGRVEVLVDGKRERTVAVAANRLYTLRSAPAVDDGLLELRFTPGVQAYAFTFG
jgi:cytochrome c biogenesis protein CcdA/thiol-disulfide isomerase/thioredoxin